MTVMEGTPDSHRAPEESEAELSARDGEEEAEEKAGGQGVGKRGPNPPPAKRPRYNDKPFGDITINDVESALREVITLKRQVASKEEELAGLREVRAEKGALAKQVKALEIEVAATQKETEKCKAAIKDHDEEVATQADRVKKACKQTLSNQMLYSSAFKDKLQTHGLEIMYTAPNVSLDVVKALGLEAGSKNKYSDVFFGAPITKTSNGTKLFMARTMSVKYFKTTCELRFDAAYTLEGAKKPTKEKEGTKKPVKKKSTKKSTAKGAADEDGAANDEDEDDEEEDGEVHDDGAEEIAAVVAADGGADV